MLPKQNYTQKLIIDWFIVWGNINFWHFWDILLAIVIEIFIVFKSIGKQFFFWHRKKIIWFCIRILSSIRMKIEIIFSVNFLTLFFLFYFEGTKYFRRDKDY